LELKYSIVLNTLNTGCRQNPDWKTVLCEGIGYMKQMEQEAAWGFAI